MSDWTEEARKRLEKLFWQRTVNRGDVQCWPWLGTIRSNGYARLWLGRQGIPAHRVAYVLTVGPVPEGLVLDHWCRNRSCVNPSHLRPVTLRENTLADGSVAPTKLNLEKQHCPKCGGPYVKARLGNRADSRTHRRCLPCWREYAKLFKRRKRAEHGAQYGR